MGWFGPKLEPGERVLLRSPPAWVSPTFGVLWLALPLSAAGLARLYSALVGLDFSADSMMLAMLGIVGVVFAFFWSRLFRWQLVVTDRRLFRRLPHDPTHYDETETQKIMGFRYLPEQRCLAVRLDDRVFDVIADRRTARRILDALGREADGIA